MFDFIKGRFEELPHQLHLDPEHSLLGPLQVSAAELIDGLPYLRLSMLMMNDIKLYEADTNIVSNVPPVEINEGEGKGYVERGYLVWVGTSFTGLESNHEVDVARRPFLLVAADDFLPEDSGK